MFVFFSSYLACLPVSAYRPFLSGVSYLSVVFSSEQEMHLSMCKTVAVPRDFQSLAWLMAGY